MSKNPIPKTFSQEKLVKPSFVHTDQAQSIKFHYEVIWWRQVNFLRNVSRRKKNQPCQEFRWDDSPLLFQEWHALLQILPGELSNSDQREDGMETLWRTSLDLFLVLWNFQRTITNSQCNNMVSNFFWNLLMTFPPSTWQ